MEIEEKLTMNRRNSDGGITAAARRLVIYRQMSERKGKADEVIDRPRPRLADFRICRLILVKQLRLYFFCDRGENKLTLAL